MSSLLQKQNLSSKELQLFQAEMMNRRKTSSTAWLLWAFTGGVGGHRFYLGRTGSAVAMLLTLGGLGIWTFVDIFLINGMVKETNEQVELEVIQEIRLYSDAEARDKASAPAPAPTVAPPAGEGA